MVEAVTILSVLSCPFNSVVVEKQNVLNATQWILHCTAHIQRENLLRDTHQKFVDFDVFGLVLAFLALSWAPIPRNCLCVKSLEMRCAKCRGWAPY